jgi:transposase-like protein
MARYGQQFKERVVARLLPPESSPVAEVSNKVGISVATLERWRAEMLAQASDDQPRRWSPAARLEAVIATAGLDETARSAWCREHGVFPTALDAWKRDAIGGLGEPREAGESAATKQDRRRIRELERDLHRKDKALAETAALLVLSKKLSAIFHDGEDA